MRRPKLEILDPEDIRQIIAAAYDLLDHFGVMVDNAEALQVLADGGAILLDMRYGTSCIGSVESHMPGSGYSLIGKYLGFPTASNIGQSDAKRVDTQAGLESGMGILLAALSGTNLSL